MHRIIQLMIALAMLALSGAAAASEYRGEVTFGGLPLPGATVKITQGSKQLAATTNQQGLYSFPDLADGKWTIEIEMTGFSILKQEVVIGPNAPAGKWELKLLPLDQIKAEINPPGSGARPGAPLNPAPGGGPGARQGVPLQSAEAKSEQAQPMDSRFPAAAEGKARNDEGNNENAAAAGEDLNQRATDGFLINGSVLNGAASRFAQSFAFGNFRQGAHGLYNGGLGLIFDNSALDSRPFSLSGQSTPKPAYNRITAVATLGGPLRIPHLIERHAPNFFVAYQWTRYVDDTAQSALVPDEAERGGDFSQALNALGQPVQIFNPATGLPFSGSKIPPTEISPQAKALLNYYPLPSFSGEQRYNYQIPISTDTHQDALQSRFDEYINPKNQLYGGFAFQSARTASPNLFGFLDTTDVLGINTSINWSHRLGPWVFLNLGYRFSRLATRATPYWEDRENVSGEAGISGNNQDPANWGPPSLAFSSGLAGLSDAQSSFDRNQTDAWSSSLLWSRDRHNITFGGDFRRQQFNYLGQQDPRGMFTFTGAATQGSANGATTGDDFADFLLGIPDTSSIAFGNADKYFRESVYDAYVTDDWRMTPQFTLNAGMRWEYGAPITELFGRLVNLDITPGFAAAAPVVGIDPVGPLTGQKYPSSLIRADKTGIESRIGIAWRPVSGSSLVVRAGYGVYYDTSVYQTIALQMAQQAPLSKSLSVQNSRACPLTLANGFITCSATTPNTFAVDPSFRIGYAQTWSLSLQRDLPGSLQLNASYLGVKGTRGVQEFLPNTFPVGGVNPCPSCPIGFAYLASNGNSSRESAQIQLRRRLHNGLTATVRYTFSKSIDDDSALGGQGAILPTAIFGPPTGGSGNGGIQVTTLTASGAGTSSPTLAQNWRDLEAERGLSTFDQRQLLNFQFQYTTGMGLGGETLLRGRKGTLFKEWTFLTQITTGSGLPQTPIYLTAVPGTGVTGTIRPDYTGAPIYAAPAGLFLNPGAYTTPLPGQWGNSGRDSIIGPAQFALNASVGRTFRLHGNFNLDFRIDSTNFLNHVTFTSWNTTVTSAQFGLPAAANAMRSMQATMRVRF
jgi:hypothetical protein